MVAHPVYLVPSPAEMAIDPVAVLVDNLPEEWDGDSRASSKMVRQFLRVPARTIQTMVLERETGLHLE
jgi:hypothetical protein